MTKLLKWLQRWLCLGLPRWIVECKLAPGENENDPPVRGYLWTHQVNSPGDPDSTPPIPPSSALVYEWWVGTTKTVVDQDFVDTLADCAQCTCGTPESWCRRTDTIEADNHTIGEPRPIGPGAVPYPWDDQTWRITLSNGVVATYMYPKFDGSSPYPNPWAHYNSHLSMAMALAAGKPVKTNPNNGNEYGVRGPDGNTATAWGAFGWVDCCPGEVTVVAIKTTTVGGPRDKRIVHLPIRPVVGEVETFTVCRSCNGDADVWRDSEGTVLQGKPDGCLFRDCNFPAGPTIPALPDCTVTTIGPLCRFDDDGNEVETGIFLDVEDCEGVRTFVWYTLDANDDPVESDGEGVRNCDGSTIEPPAEPVPVYPPVLGEPACVTVNGENIYAYPAALAGPTGFIPAGWLIPGPTGLEPVTGEVEVADPCDCPCGCDDDDCVPSCAWGAGGVANDTVWQVSEGGLTWTICGEAYVMPPGDYSNSELGAWITANTPHTMTVIPDPADPASDIVYLSIPCDCPAPTFQFGDDPSTALATLPQFNEDCGDAPEMQVYTLFSKFPNPHPEASSYPGIAHVGSLLTGADPGANSTHPGGAQAGISINGWNVFQVCAASTPSDDSNNHYWLPGSPSSFAASLTYSGTPAPDLSC